MPAPSLEPTRECSDVSPTSDDAVEAGAVAVVVKPEAPTLVAQEESPTPSRSLSLPASLQSQRARLTSLRGSAPVRP